MEVFRFDYDQSEKTFEQESFIKMWPCGSAKKHLLSSQLLFVTKNRDEKLCSADLNSFTFYKIVQSLQKFGVPFETKTLDFEKTPPNGNTGSFFIQLSEKIGARIDDNLYRVNFGKSKKEQKIQTEICKKCTFAKSKLEIFIVVQKLESKVTCFIFGRNGEDKTKTCTKTQVHHYLLCLHAFTELK